MRDTARPAAVLVLLVPRRSVRLDSPPTVLSMTTKPTILVVDDDQPILLLMQNVLREFQFETLTASTGERAVELAKDHRPDLILLDLNMPGMSGGAVIDALRAESDAARQIPIVILSGDPVEPAELERLGAVDAIQKPFDLAALVKTIRLHSGSHRTP